MSKYLSQQVIEFEWILVAKIIIIIVRVVVEHHKSRVCMSNECTIC